MFEDFVDLVDLVCLVDLVYLVCLVHESVRKAITPLPYVLSHARSPSTVRSGSKERDEKQDTSDAEKVSGLNI